MFMARASQTEIARDYRALRRYDPPQRARQPPLFYLGGRRMKILKTCTVMLALLSAASAFANESVMKELAPTGTLRIGLVFAPSMSAFFVVKDESGKPRGVTADIGAALGKKLGLPFEFMLYPNSGQATDAVESGAIDVSFMPVDEERKKRIAFGPAYEQEEST